VTSPAALLLDGNSLTLEDMESVARSGREVGLAPAARAGVVRARKIVDDAVSQNAVVYGVTTGFGNFADVVIPATMFLGRIGTVTLAAALAASTRRQLFRRPEERPIVG